MKKSLILLSAFVCGSVLAQENAFTPSPRPPAQDRPEERNDFARFAQAPPQAPKSGGGPAPKPIGAPPTPPPGAPGVPFGSGGGGGSFGGFPGREAVSPFEQPATRTLVVGAKLDDTERQNIREDMQIMSRLLDKAVERALDNRQDRRMGIVVTSLPGIRGENLFLEDYGPVFILNVPMPLTGLKKTEGTEKEQNPSDWEQAKRELYEKRSLGSFEPMRYDAQKVDALKQALLESLKNAANIRQLKSDQMITVIVTGSENLRGVINRKIVTKQEGQPPREEVRHETFEGKAGPQPTTLTIRVKKSDVDAFSKGKMDAQEFAKKAMISSN